MSGAVLELAEPVAAGAQPLYSAQDCGGMLEVDPQPRRSSPTSASQTILLSIVFISSNEKARKVSDLTLPREQTLKENAVALSSSGASHTATTSWLPSVQ